MQMLYGAGAIRRRFFLSPGEDTLESGGGKELSRLVFVEILLNFP
jgi:hypothetical protein